MKIKPYLLASVVSAVPFAADAAPPPPVPFAWTGFYVGGSAGFIGQGATGNDIGGELPHGLINNAGDQYGVSGVGGLFGANVGYNYQMGNIVLGLEADIAASTLSNTYNFVGPLGSAVSSKLDSLGTVRARFGYAFDRMLIYATGGFAYGHVKNSATKNGSVYYTVSTSGQQTGWTAGGGLEYAFLKNWTVHVEALYVDLGTVEGISSGFNFCSCRFGFKNRYTLGRLGLNYKF